MEYPPSNPTFIQEGSWYPEDNTGQVSPDKTLLDDGVEGYLWVQDAWTGQWERARWVWDFGNLAYKKYYVEWHGIITSHPACYAGACYFIIEVSPDNSTWTLVRQYYLTPPCPQSSSFGLETVTIEGNYRYVRATLYSTTSGMASDPTKLWVDYVGRETVKKAKPASIIPLMKVLDFLQTKPFSKRFPKLNPLSAR